MPEFYATLFGRRDVRSDFLADPLPDEVLAKLLLAAHYAPSVGLSQPWNFILIQDPLKKADVYAAFVEANEEAVDRFPAEKRGAYCSLKLQGILDAPVTLCVTCDRSRGGEVVLGKTHQPEMDLYSTVCAVQNLWLAARAESVGVGWVSIIEPQRLCTVLQLPEPVVPVALLCLGYVKKFRAQPELEQRGWEQRLPVADLVYRDSWGDSIASSELEEALDALRDWPRRAAED